MRFGLVVSVVFGSTTAVFSQSSDQSPARNIAAAWHSCVNAAFNRQYAATRDGSLSAEIAFQSCKTEEDAVLVVAGGIPDGFQTLVLIKTKKKRELTGLVRALPN